MSAIETLDDMIQTIIRGDTANGCVRVYLEYLLQLRDEVRELAVGGALSCKRAEFMEKFVVAAVGQSRDVPLDGVWFAKQAAAAWNEIHKKVDCPKT